MSAPISYKLTPRAKAEIAAHSLDTNQAYIAAFARYSRGYSERRPHGVPDRNMVKALRMLPWLNTMDDWARLHVCEAFLKARKA